MSGHNPAPTPPRPSLIKNEFTLQRECCRWVRYHHPEILFTATCGGLSKARMNKKMMDMGYLRGVPDIVFLSAPVAIELKWKRGVAKPHQKDIMGAMEWSGWECHVIRTYDDFINCVKENVLGRMLHDNM